MDEHQRSPSANSPEKLDQLRSENMARIYAITGGTGHKQRQTRPTTGIPRVRHGLTQQFLPVSEAGGSRSLPVNIAEPYGVVSVNHIRSKRVALGSALSGRGWVAGNTYSPSALLDNWSEERAAHSWRPELNKCNPNHVKRGFRTTQCDSWEEALEDYREKLKTSKAIAKGTGTLDYRSLRSKQGQPDMVYYSASSASGTIRPACPDGTPERAKGGYWIGTAPAKMWETVGTVYGKEAPPFRVPEGSSKLEFQRRAMWGTPKDRVLCTMREVPPELMERANTRHNSSNRFTSTWKSVAAKGYVSHVGHRAAPQLNDDLRSTRLSWTPATSVVNGEGKPLRSTTGKMPAW